MPPETFADFPARALENLQKILPDREVGAARARVLRKRGENIRFHHFTANGHSRYLWKAAEMRWPWHAGRA